MPIITIEIVPQEYDKKVEIAKAFTDELQRITGIPKEPMVVLFHELEAENFAPAGELLTEMYKDDFKK